MTDLETQLRSSLAVQAETVEAQFDGPAIRARVGRRPTLPAIPAPASVAAAIVVATAVAIALVVLVLAPPQRHHVIRPGGPVGTVTPHRPTGPPPTSSIPTVPTSPPQPLPTRTGVTSISLPTGRVLSRSPGTHAPPPGASVPGGPATATAVSSHR